MGKEDPVVDSHETVSSASGEYASGPQPAFVHPPALNLVPESSDLIPAVFEEMPRRTPDARAEV